MWFPDSALKTAHAMEEFDLEGLPLFVLANWRGFSGGQRDLFEGVLQVGRWATECFATWIAFPRCNSSNVFMCIRYPECSYCGVVRCVWAC